MKASEASRGGYLQAGAQTLALSAKKLQRGRSGRLKRAGVMETSEVVHGQGAHTAEDSSKCNPPMR